VEQADPLRVLEPSVEMLGVGGFEMTGTTVRQCGGAGIRVAESVGVQLDVVVHDCSTTTRGRDTAPAPTTGTGSS
jgi:hypothetical protein